MKCIFSVDVEDWFLEQTRYALGPKELQGLTVFLEMAGAEGLCPEGVGIAVAGKGKENVEC